jgi:hypothetical protein
LPVAHGFGVARLAPPESPDWVQQREREEFLTRLQEDLASTGVFEAVVRGDDVPADVVVASQFSRRYCFSEPLIAAVTFGIIPHPSCYYSGYLLTIRGDVVPNGAIVVDSRSQPGRLLGWIAGPLSLLPGWSASLPRKEEVQVLRAALLSAAVRTSGARPAEDDVSR